MSQTFWTLLSSLHPKIQLPKPQAVASITAHLTACVVISLANIMLLPRQISMQHPQSIPQTTIQAFPANASRHPLRYC